jgi:RNA polymerase-binding transcription factor DksA
MAKKLKKPASKPAKKAAKAKPAPKATKAPAKPTTAKAAPAKPAKKAPAKPVAKKVVAKPVPAPKKGKATIEKVEKKAAPRTGATPTTKSVTPPASKKGESAAHPKVAPQLTIFPQLTQRPIAHKPVKATVEDNRTRYSDEELKEFEILILGKLEKAREEFKLLKDTLTRSNDEGTDATSGGNTKVLEDGAETAEKENLSQLAARQQKYITNLENALVRIKNGTYGICSVTGKLISKERLIAVPHTTQSIEAKMMKQD